MVYMLRVLLLFHFVFILDIRSLVSEILEFVLPNLIPIVFVFELPLLVMNSSSTFNLVQLCSSCVSFLYPVIHVHWKKTNNLQKTKRD